MPASNDAQPRQSAHEQPRQSAHDASSKPSAVVTHHVHAHFQIDSDKDEAQANDQHQAKARIHDSAGDVIAHRGEMGQTELESAVDKAKAEIERIRADVLRKEGEVMRMNESLQIKEYSLGILQGALRARHGVWPQSARREPRKEAAKAAIKEHLKPRDGVDGVLVFAQDGNSVDEDALEALVTSIIASGVQDKKEREEGETIVIPAFGGPVHVSRGTLG